jgi:hypothetical protein
MILKGLHSGRSLLVVSALLCGVVACGTMSGEAVDADAGDGGDSGLPGEGTGECVLVAEPGVVEMGRVEPGATTCVDVVVTNTGSSACRVTGYTVLSESGAYSAESFAERYPRIGVLELAPAGSTDGITEMVVAVCFAPLTNNFERGALDVLVDSLQRPTAFRVPLEANGGFACIDVAPELAFGAVRTTLEATEELTITHCGDVDAPNPVPLVVSDIRWADAGGDAVFSLLPQTLPLQLAPGESATATVVYSPRTTGADSRRVLEIQSNDEYRPVVEVAVTGTAADVNCPTAVPRCRVSGSSMPRSNEVAARPLDTLDCISSASDDLNGEIVGYRWEVLRRPSGSRTNFDAPTSASSSFFVDLAGEYEMQLTTINSEGCESPVPGRISVRAVPDEDLQIVLVWETPADPDPTGEWGTDVDLHFLHPSGCWEDSAWDVHFRSANPNWGDRDRTDDNPSLDIDSVDGLGPEIINFDNPEDGVTYRIGVHYWSDHGFGPIEATVQVYVGGTLAYQRASESMRNGQFWDVATLSWPSGEFTTIDQYYDDIDAAPCR